MICSEGYKAFRGTMRIVPKNPNMKPYELTADWLYKPEYQCWYGRGSSFPEGICEVLVDLTVLPHNGPLTLDELKGMDGEPVWCAVHNSPGGGYYCLCDKGVVMVPSGLTYDCEEISGWAFYRHKPEGVFV